MRRIIYIALIYMYVCAYIKGEDLGADREDLYRLDSLKQEFAVQLTSDPEAAINTLYLIVQRYSSYQIDSSYYYSSIGIELAKRMQNKSMQAFFWQNKGTAYVFKADYNKGIECINEALRLHTELDDYMEIIHDYNLFAFNYVSSSRYLSAIDCYFKCIEIAENADTAFINVALKKRIIAARAVDISELFRRIDNYEMALKYLDIAKNNVDTARQYYIYAQILTEFAFHYLELDDVDKALEYALKADRLLPDPVALIKIAVPAKYHLAKCYLRLGDYDRAMQYARDALDVADVLIENTLYSEIYTVISDIYLEQDYYAEAEAAAMQAYEILDSINTDQMREAVNNIILANIYLKNSEKAAFFLKKYNKINTEYSNKRFHSAISELEVKYEVDKKELMISKLMERQASDKKQRILFICLGTVLFMLIVTLTLYYNLRLKQERRRQELLVANSVIEAESREREEIARDLHDELGGMLFELKKKVNDKNDLNTVNRKIDACVEEVRRISRHLMPASLNHQGLRGALEDYCQTFPNVIFHFFGISERIDSNIEINIYRCVYELVKNALKHSGAQTVHVQLLQEFDHIVVTIQDDGTGFDPDTVKRGSGLNNIEKRVSDMNGTFNIDSSSDGKGTEIVLDFML